MKPIHYVAAVIVPGEAVYKTSERISFTPVLERGKNLRFFAQAKNPASGGSN